jgi:poly-gamma-glutamate synthase PgsB/CapB
LSAFLLYLVYERITLDRLRRSIPLVIVVTGTRGKSTVVRLLASVLRESGRVVLAKSTGSQAQYVLPDGSTETVKRRGMVSILEQKKTLRKAVELGADCLVAEIMSIQPQNHAVESRDILKPNIIVLTNIRRDHTEAMGANTTDIAKVLQHAFVEGTEVFLLPESMGLIDPSEIRDMRLNLTLVPSSSSTPASDTHGASAATQFSENIDLVVAVARKMNIDDAAIARGLQKTVHDIGRFRIWRVRIKERAFFVVSGFAANDPESTSLVLDKTRRLLGGATGRITGLLSLRADRPDRTVQWIEALRSGFSKEFKRLYVLGGHANVVRRKVTDAVVLGSQPPEEIMHVIARSVGENDVVFGFGNIAGAGEQLVAFWQREGTEHGI